MGGLKARRTGYTQCTLSRDKKRVDWTKRRIVLWKLPVNFLNPTAYTFNGIIDKVIAGKEYTGLRGNFARIQGAMTGA
ncbi:MAG: hypothetical protein BECKG1743F_GA0114225_112752 [Candidatus Kentron sp. G]|nr:MAG: hypothetical protein BECKG1743F_GA0114225_112752 [Candidatus Kentron sp. G]